MEDIRRVGLLWWYAAKIKYCKYKQLFFRGIYNAVVYFNYMEFSLLKTHPINITILCVLNCKAQTILRWELVQFSKLFSKFQRNFSLIFFMESMKRKINCLYLDKILLWLMPKYLWYSEVGYSASNFTCADVIINSIC